jgi:hypothetical protein
LFLKNHIKDLVSIEFFVVPTVSFRVLFVFVVLAHDRRRVLHFNVTEHPTGQWAGQQEDHIKFISDVPVEQQMRANLI